MIEQKDHKDREKNKTQQKLERKPYVKPQLKEYGHIETLTQTGGSSSKDSNQGRALG